MADIYCIPENKDGESIVKLSPSGKYKLTISFYKTREGCWGYSKGVVTRVSDDSVIAEIARNYSNFHHTFFIRDQSEWLCTGKTYLSQCFVNLDTGEVYDNLASKEQHSFCWSKVYANPSGTILAVNGCVWGGPYEINFYDFSDPSKGWPLIKYNSYDIDYDLYCGEEFRVKWIDNETFDYENYGQFCPFFNKNINELTREEDSHFDHFTYEEYDSAFVDVLNYHVVVKYIDNEIHFIIKDASEYYIKLLVDRQLRQENTKRYEAMIKESPIFTQFKTLCEELNAKLYITLFDYKDQVESLNDLEYKMTVNHNNSYHMVMFKYGKISLEDKSFDNVAECIKAVRDSIVK